MSRQIIVNEVKGIQENQFLYEERLQSPLKRFLETTPIFVTYYHVVNEASMADTGYQDAFSLIGSKSPIRYQKINNFPLYGVPQLQIQLQTLEQGIDGSFDGEAVILPNTIKPFPNDFFVIPYANNSTRNAFLFRVTEIQYDVVRADGYYKINFILEYNDEEKLTEIERQVIQNNEYVLDTGIIESSTYSKLQEIKAIYDDIKDTYYSIFYNERHNCFLGDLGSNLLLYDPYQTAFINRHALFNDKHNFVVLILTDQFTDPQRKLKYEKSLYRCIERQDIDLLNNFNFIFYPGVTQLESTFYRWVDKRVMILDHPINSQIKPVTPIISNEFLASIRLNGITTHPWQTLIQKYMRKETLTVEDVDPNLNDSLLTLNTNLELFFFTPIILYILKKIISSVTFNVYDDKTTVEDQKSN